MDSLTRKMGRRAFLRGGGLGLGTLAFNALLQPGLLGGGAHHRATARSVIFLHMTGAPSQLDLFDHKPVLREYDRRLAPDDFVKGKRFAFLRGHPKLLGSPFAFRRHGDGGIWISELLPHLAAVSDELAVVKSVHTTEFNHGPAQLFFHTGLNRLGNPALGAWVNYGLGSPNEDLPGYVVFVSGKIPGAGSALWGNGFLPGVHQGVEFRSQGDPVLFLSSPDGVPPDRRRRILDRMQELNGRHLEAFGDPEILTRMKQYEMAFRMQTAVPELMDLSDEPESVRAAYGEGEFARHCLHARRLVERGVRFVELFNADWDTHSNQEATLRRKCREIDQPIAALLRDLRQRGLLDRTLVVWGGEFGRTPMLQGSEDPAKCGRDHHKEAFTIWMAGGGVRGGCSHGETDELGCHIAEHPVAIRDLHATILHALGLQHARVTFRFNGLDQRLTGVDEEARVVREILT